MNKLCQCGCGKETFGGKFIRGHGSRTLEVKEKRKLSCLNHYGVEHPSKVKEIQEKKKQTSLIRYGTKSWNSSNIIKKRKQESCLLKYNVDNPFKLNEVKEKIKQTNLRKFNVEYTSQREDIKEKKRKTNLKKIGIDNIFKNIDYIKKCNFKKFGTDNWSKTLQGKLFFRIKAIKEREIRKLNNEFLMPNIGSIERQFLNESQLYTIYDIIRNDPSFRYIIGRFPDGHILQLRLIIQFDEKEHFLDKECKFYKQDDIDCTLEFASLGYIIWRVSELEWIQNKEKVIEQFKLLIKELTEIYEK